MADEITDFGAMRGKIKDDLVQEVLGPSAAEELLYEDPVTRYSAGMIFPDHYESRRENAAVEELEDQKDAETVSAEDDAMDDQVADPISTANSFYPSVFGLSFFTKASPVDLVVRVSSARYRAAEAQEVFLETGDLPEVVSGSEEFKEHFLYLDGKTFCKKEVPSSVIKSLEAPLKENKLLDTFYRLSKLSQGAWKRIPITHEIRIDKDYKSQLLEDGLLLVCNQVAAGDGTMLLTLGLQNTHPACKTGMDAEHVFFQNVMNVAAANADEAVFVSHEKNPDSIADDEERSLSLLYRNKKNFAVGHGCAVSWEIGKDGNATKLTAQAIPHYEVPQIEFDQQLDAATEVLGMQYLSDVGEKNNDVLFGSLKEFCNGYERWVAEKEGELKNIGSYRSIGERHLQLCRESLERMLAGIEILKSDDSALRAFRLANRSMLLQGLHSELQKQRANQSDGSEITWPNPRDPSAASRRWRPFQLAFMLLSVRGIVQGDSTDRDIVDLIWFPTGGGKTEAYLGLTAFVSLYRRIKFGAAGGGTAVIMRYTLRLLTSQQFQRACALVCALEYIRRTETGQNLGADAFSIGLWVGATTTPNTIDDAIKELEKFCSNYYAPNPSPVLFCPWCGTSLIQKAHGRNRRYGYRQKKPKSIELYCFEKTCAFSDSLPFEFIDEQIYRNPPTVLFGTVDKFAQIPWREGISRIFALSKGDGRRSPELIIQDELHLIAGALGTMVALYETAIDYFCSNKGQRPKIIVSTATTKRSGEQCRSLFNRQTRQFPQPGLDASDSYFAREAPLSSRPGRLYLGVMASGKTQTTALVRLTAAILQSVDGANAEDKIKDKYWTLVSYFNSIRELGGYISLIMDDVPAQQGDMKKRYGGHMRPITTQEELTSRKKAWEIPEILNQLFIEYPKSGRIDVLSATNMISVGVDVDRLNAMIIRGQPKATAEYIQASSRIGRKYPGVVVALFNSARTRDRAHYERFINFHESFYRFVEPSSITPFSGPARTRGLQAVLVAMIRHATDADGSGNIAKDLDAEAEDVKKIRQYIIDRVRDIDPGELSNTQEDIEQALRDWRKLVDVHGDNLTMGATGKIFDVEGVKIQGWDAPTSMRNVDADSCVECID